MKTVLERSDQVLSNELLTYVKCSLFFHINIPIAIGYIKLSKFKFKLNHKKLNAPKNRII